MYFCSIVVLFCLSMGKLGTTYFTASIFCSTTGSGILKKNTPNKKILSLKTNFQLQTYRGWFVLFLVGCGRGLIVCFFELEITLVVASLCHL
jgi:hypothetical protein